MEAGNQYGFAEDVSIDCFHDGRACVGGLLWRRHSHIAFGIHGIQLKRVVMLRSATRRHAHATDELRRNHTTIFPCRRRHEDRRHCRSAAATTTATTLAATGALPLSHY